MVCIGRNKIVTGRRLGSCAGRRKREGLSAAKRDWSSLCTRHLGSIGGSLAGLAVSFVCGPAEPACGMALVFIGSNLGGMAAEAGNDVYQDELPVFMHWMND